MIRKLIIMAYALLSYIAGTGAFIALILFLSGWLPTVSINNGEEKPILLALSLNSGLMLLWTLQHIGMARQPCKKALAKILPRALERSTYMLFTGIAIGVIIAFWSPVNTSIYTVENALAAGIIESLYIFGWGYAISGILYDSYLEFHGLKQVYYHLNNRPFSPALFKSGFVFKLCRRPTFFGILIACWATPNMTIGHLYFSVTMTIFTLIGCYFVERTYVQMYGDSYRKIQSEKPLLIPNLKLLFR